MPLSSLIAPQLNMKCGKQLLIKFWVKIQKRQMKRPRTTQESSSSRNLASRKKKKSETFHLFSFRFNKLQKHILRQKRYIKLKNARITKGMGKRRKEIKANQTPHSAKTRREARQRASTKGIDQFHWARCMPSSYSQDIKEMKRSSFNNWKL